MYNGRKVFLGLTKEKAAGATAGEAGAPLQRNSAHTTEAGEDGPTYSYRGIDNDSYYLLTSDQRQYINDTGCGNTVRTGHPAGRVLVLESLDFWARTMGVDGFRFDLASILSRAADGTMQQHEASLVAEISLLGRMQNFRLIA